jgi:glycerate kinase
LSGRTDLGTNFSNTPGAGAAGGFGYGVLTFLNGQIMPGFNVVAEKVGLRERMASTDIVITGEGRLDFQTLQGKAPYGVASLAKQMDKPVWAIGALSKTVYFWRVISIICLRWFRMTPRWNRR